MLGSLPTLKQMLGITDALQDGELASLLMAAETALSRRYSLPTVPETDETRVLFVDGGVLHLDECSEVTAITTLEDDVLLFIEDAGKRPDDFLNGVILREPFTGRVKVTGTWGADYCPDDVSRAIHETAKTWYRRSSLGDGGNDYIGRLDAIPKVATDLMDARR